jgi:predicted DNA-binding protein
MALPDGRFSRALGAMEVHFAPETEKKLNDLAAQSGRGTADSLVQDAVEGYFDELTQTLEMLNGRYDDLKSGRVKPIPGDEVVTCFREKSASAVVSDKQWKAFNEALERPARVRPRLRKLLTEPSILDRS